MFSDGKTLSGFDSRNQIIKGSLKAALYYLVGVAGVEPTAPTRIASQWADADGMIKKSACAD